MYKINDEFMLIIVKRGENMKRKKYIIFSVILSITVVIIGIVVIISVVNYDNAHFVIKDTLPDGNGKNARIILLAGQSNAAGCSLDEYLKINVSKEKYQEYEHGYENVYINYFCSGNNISSEFVNCKTNQGETIGYFGPELGLSEALHKNYPDELFFIIKYTWSGTNLFEQWLSPSSSGKTGKLYKEFISFTIQSIEYLTSKDYNVQIEGLCWMQGESDSFSEENATNYEFNLLNFIKDVRKKLSKYSSNDGIAFIDAYIADNPIYWVFCDLVNKSKEKVDLNSNMNALIDTNSHGLTCSNEPSDQVDMAHYDSMSEIKLGHLFAEYISKYF